MPRQANVVTHGQAWIFRTQFLTVLLGHHICVDASFKGNPRDRRGTGRRVLRKITSFGKRADYTTAGVAVFKHLREEIDGIMARDPAARSRAEVALCYPGFHAVVMHRVAHYCWERGWRLLARTVSHISRALTGIEITLEATLG